MQIVHILANSVSLQERFKRFCPNAAARSFYTPFEKFVKNDIEFIIFVISIPYNKYVCVRLIY